MKMSLRKVLLLQCALLGLVSNTLAAEDPFKLIKSYKTTVTGTVFATMGGGQFNIFTGPNKKSEKMILVGLDSSLDGKTLACLKSFYDSGNDAQISGTIVEYSGGSIEFKTGSITYCGSKK